MESDIGLRAKATIFYWNWLRIQVSAMHKNGNQVNENAFKNYK